MTEHNRPEPPSVNQDPESSGDAALDARLAEGILKGHAGLDTAQAAMAAFLIVVAAFLAFSTAFSAPFSFDAARLVVENTALHRVPTVAGGISQAPDRALGMLALAANWWIAPNSALAFHIFDFLLHAVCGMLLFGIARRLFSRADRSIPEPVAMLAGLLFALHPLVTDAVVDAAARPLILATVFMLASVYAFQGGRASGFGPGMVTSLGAFLLALAAHPAALALPLVILALEWVAPGRRVRRAATFWVIAASYLALWWGATGSLPVSPASEGAWGLPGAGYLTKRMLFPVHLSVYPVPGASAALFGIGGLTLAAVLAALLTWRRSPGAVPVLWSLTLLASALWFAPAGLREQLAYPALAAACLLVPWGFEFIRPAGARAAAGIFVAVLALFLGGITFVRANTWVDPVRLWSAAVTLNPEAATAHERLGLLHLNRSEAIALTDVEGRDAAIEAAQTAAHTHLTRAAELGAVSVDLYEGLGRVHLLREGEAAEALAAFQEALRVRPRDTDLLAYAGEATARVALDANDRRGLVQALRYLQMARAAQSLEPGAAVMLGNVQAALGRFAEAADTLDGVARITGENALASNVAQLRQVGEALTQLQQRAAEVRGRDPLQALLLDSQRDELRHRALQALHKASYVYQEQPGNWQAWVSLGAAKTRMGEIEGFLAREVPPPATPEGVPPAWRLLAGKAAFGGAWDAASKVVEACAPDENAGLVLGELALELGQAQRAEQYLTAATRQSPQDYRPWVRLAENALAQGNPAQAGRHAREAERRGAPAETLRRLQHAGAVSGGGEAVPMIR